MTGKIEPNELTSKAPPNNSVASARKRSSSSVFDLFVSIHSTARSNHLRAMSFSPNCQWLIARKNQSEAPPPLPNSIDFSSAARAALQSPARY